MRAGRSGGEEKRALCCPSCGCRDLRVMYTRQKAFGVVRMRRCRNCGKRVRTVERTG